MAMLSPELAVPIFFVKYDSVLLLCVVTSRQAKTVSALSGWTTDLSARRVRLRRDFKSRGSPAHREFSRKCELE
jgi:hypothetical protein